MQDSDLEDIFAQARAEPPAQAAALIARIEADAVAMQQAWQDAARRKAPPARRRVWSGWFANLGGGGAFAGLAGATIAGVWLGVAQPAPIATLTETLSSAFTTQAPSDPVELIPTYDAFSAEG